jgi:hypothetical protein
VQIEFLHWNLRSVGLQREIEMKLCALLLEWLLIQWVKHTTTTICILGSVVLEFDMGKVVSMSMEQNACKNCYAIAR